MNNLRDIKTIETYLHGNMTEEEMEDIEIRILLDKEFRQEFETARILIKGIKESAKQTTIKEKIQNLENSSTADLSLKDFLPDDAKGKVIRFNRRRALMVSGMIAAVIILFVFVALPIFSPQNLSPEQLFVQNFKVSPNMGIQSTRGDVSTDPVTKAYQAYDDKNYTEAARLFESVVDTSDYRLTDLFHLANCYLILEQWSKAITALEEVVQSNNGLAENAKWYLALTYVRTGEYQKAKTLLNEVATPRARVKEARKIVKQLN